MDASRGYHQIKMNFVDEEKIAFITEYGLYCWKPERGEVLQLYLAVSDGVVSSVLIHETEGQQKPIYYIYFESHHVQVVTNQPVKRVIINPKLSGRLTTWAIELSEFDISYVPRTSIKAQAFVDFMVECTTQSPQIISGSSNFKPGTNNPEWVMLVDGAKNEKGLSTGILIRGPDEIVMEYALRFTFPTTNNEAEYEALVAGLAIVKSLGITRIWVKGNSKLMMDQVRGVCGVRHEPLAQNEEADHLSRLATTYYDELPKGAYVEVREKPAHKEVISMPVLGEPEDSRTPIVRYLVTGQLPENVTEARRMKNRSFWFYMYNKELYKKVMGWVSSQLGVPRRYTQSTG
ncbi:hypothetical protein LIER_16727 [Lithospermum erythrorhizon]|uniref:RNase H type-1 domain-containing protein n=1 Tax=Lithospermum erythrorhizon TaxID=34254 RepID=A0AAV3Q7S0_LITER